MSNKSGSSTKQKQTTKKIILALLLLSPVFVMLAATLTYKMGYVPETKQNKGQLIQPPVEIVNLALRTQGGELFDYAQNNLEYGRWHLIVFSSGGCSERCRDQLWLTRQLHVALGHRAHFVARYLVSVGTPLGRAFKKELKNEHPRLQTLMTQEADYQQFVAHFEQQEFDPIDNNQFILVDPNGWVMMYYDAHNSGQDVIHDLKYLLKKQGK